MNPFTRRRRTETGGEPVYKPLPRLPAPELGEAWRERAAEAMPPHPRRCRVTARMRPRQGALFPLTPPTVHIGRRHRVIPDWVCVMCGAALSVVAAYADCDCCPGYVAPVAAGVGLAATEGA